MNKIMIVEDDRNIGNMLEETLSNEGYSVLRAYSGTQALDAISENKPDLILLDLMLPELSGEDIIETIRNIPVIVVSAKAEISDKVKLLHSGAVDYITKPFHIEELLARIDVQLRKKFSLEKNISYHTLSLDLESHIVTANGQTVRLTRTEYAILKLLMERPEQVVAKLTILENIANDTPDCTEDSLKIHVHNLRKKLKSAVGKDYISAVWGIGFMLTAKS